MCPGHVSKWTPAAREQWKQNTKLCLPFEVMVSHLRVDKGQAQGLNLESKVRKQCAFTQICDDDWNHSSEHARPVVSNAWQKINDWQSPFIKSSSMSWCSKSTFCWRSDNKPSTVSNTNVAQYLVICCCSKVCGLSERLTCMLHSNVFKTFLPCSLVSKVCTSWMYHLESLKSPPS